MAVAAATSVVEGMVAVEDTVVAATMAVTAPDTAVEDIGMVEAAIGMAAIITISARAGTACPTITTTAQAITMTTMTTTMRSSIPIEVMA